MAPNQDWMIHDFRRFMEERGDLLAAGMTDAELSRMYEEMNRDPDFRLQFLQARVRWHLSGK